MAHVSGNAAWQDYPNTSTIISAGALEAIEGQLDRAPDDVGNAVFLTSAAQSVNGNAQMPLATVSASTTHVANTSATVKTINTAGLWAIGGGAEIATNASIVFATWVGVTTVSGRRYASQSKPASTYPSGNVFNIVPLDAGTQLSLWVYTSAAVTTTTAYNSGTTFLSLTLLRRF